MRTWVQHALFFSLFLADILGIRVLVFFVTVWHYWYFSLRIIRKSVTFFILQSESSLWKSDILHPSWKYDVHTSVLRVLLDSVTFFYTSGLESLVTKWLFFCVSVLESFVRKWQCLQCFVWESFVTEWHSVGLYLHLWVLCRDITVPFCKLKLTLESPL